MQMTRDAKATAAIMRKMSVERHKGGIQYLNYPNANRTILVSSHIWWTDVIAYALHTLGFNVMLTGPMYEFYTRDSFFDDFDNQFHGWAKTIREKNVDLILSGNSTAMVMHPETKQMLHDTAGVPLVNYWWDEPRSRPPMMDRGLTYTDYLTALRSPTTMNVFWDREIREEMDQVFGVTNGVHVPLGTVPEWFGCPMNPSSIADRRWDISFVGNHYPGTPGSNETEWQAAARRAGELRAQDLDRSVADCVREVAGESETQAAFFELGDESEESIARAFRSWSTVNLGLNTLRDEIVKSLVERFGNRMLLVGRFWDELGIQTHSDSMLGEETATAYGDAKLSLNLFGGCCHSGMPLRPFDTATCHGLIFSLYNKELPDLYELNRECVAFRNIQEMHSLIDRVLARPAYFDRIVAAGRQRTMTQHTWMHRLTAIMHEATSRFDVSWR